MMGDLRVFKSGATRSEDAEEERFDLISPFALQRLARVYAEGAKPTGRQIGSEGCRWMQL